MSLCLPSLSLFHQVFRRDAAAGAGALCWHGKAAFRHHGFGDGRQLGLRGDGGLHVALDHAAARPGASQRRRVDALAFGKMPGARGDGRGELEIARGRLGDGQVLFVSIGSCGLHTALPSAHLPLIDN
jgi:hypothetical protein